MTSRGIRAASRSDASTSTASVRRFRLFTPMMRAPLSTARASFLVVVHLDQRRQAQLPRPRCSAHEIRLLERRDDQQHGVGARRARASSSWYSSTMKSLRRSGSATRRAHGREMLERAVEERRLGQHRDRRGATACSCCAAIAHGIVARRASTPLDGDRRLHSAITLTRPGAPSAARNAVPRGDAAAGAPLERAERLLRRRRVSTIRRVAATIVREQVWRGGSCDRLRSCDCPPSARASLSPRPNRWPRPPRCDPLADRRQPRPATNSAAPALSSTTSRGAARVRRRARSRMIAAFSAASPPCSVGRTSPSARPKSRRVHVERVHRAAAALGHLRVAGRRDLVDAVGAVHDPGALRAEQQQRARQQLGQLRPRHADDLPRRARRVRQRPEQVERRADAEIASASARHAASTGETSARRRTRCPRRAGVRSTTAGDAATLTPSASNTSALPQRLDTDRLPCFATVTPHAATTIAAADEMLNVPDRSPPVPHVSNTSPAGARQLAPHARASSARSRRSPTAARPSSTSADQQRRRARRRGTAFHDLAHRRGGLVGR